MALSPKVSSVHDVLHVSMLKKYVTDQSHILGQELILMREDLTYEEKRIRTLDKEDKVLRNKKISLLKVLWRDHKMEEATCERKNDMRV